MTLLCRIVLLGWFFVAAGQGAWGDGITVMTVIGPFESKDDCERVRRAVDQFPRVVVTACWEKR